MADRFADSGVPPVMPANPKQPGYYKLPVVPDEEVSKLIDPMVRRLRELWQMQDRCKLTRKQLIDTLRKVN